MKGLGGFILGGALQGAGKGLQQKVEEDVLARREARLDALRQQERQEDRANRVSDLQFQETANAQGDVRRANLGMATDNNRFNNEAQLGSAAAAAKAEADKTAEERRIDAENREEEREKRLIDANTNAEIRRAIATREEKPEDIITDDDGNVTVIYSRNGKPVAVPLPGVRGKATQPKASEASSLLDQRGGVAPPATGQAKQTAKTATMADVAQTAKETGLTPAMVKRMLIDDGYTIK